MTAACASHLSAREAASTTSPESRYVLGQILIWTTKPDTDKVLLQWIKQRGDTVLAHIPQQHFYQIKLKQHQQELQAIKAYKKQPNIAGAELNYKRKRR